MLFRSESGAGKSDLGLRLIAMGAQLIADDQTSLFVRDQRLYASAPPALLGQMEIRGAGIVKMDAAAPAPVILAVKLQKEAPPRLPEPETWPLPPAFSGINPPVLLRLCPFESSAPAKIAAVAAALYRGGFAAGLAEPPSRSFL